MVMIVRILGEGQYDVADAAVDRLNELDAVLESAVEAGDQARFSAALAALLDGVRTVGVRHPDDDIAESDVILPYAEADLEQVREFLREDGLIPG